MRGLRRAASLALGLGVAIALYAACNAARMFYAETDRREVAYLREGPQGEAIWGVWTGHSFAYGIETGPRSVALIDAGSDPEAGALLAQLRARHLSPSDVHTIILTHGHDEVQAGLAHFAQATIFVGPDDWVQARRDVLPKPWLAKLQGKAMRTRRLDKPRLQPLWPGQQVTLGMRQARLVALPGHTWGSYAVVMEGIAFVGDSIAGTFFKADDHRGAQSVRLFGRTLSVSPKHNSWALHRLVGMHFKQMATAHAGVVALDEEALSAWLKEQPPVPEPSQG